MARLILALGVALAAFLPAAAGAQVSLTADRIYLGATGCVIRTGAGAPTGGTACDLYLDTASGHVWINHGGTWIDASTRTPTFTTVTATSAITTPILTATTSVSTPLLTAAADLTLRPTGDLVLDPTGRDVLPATNYGVILGSPTRQFLAAHIAELWAESLVAQDVMSTIGGRIMIAPTTVLTAPLPAIASSMTVKHNNLVSGDRVLLQNAPGGIAQTEWIAINSPPLVSGPEQYTYTVTRNLDGSGANAWVEGDAVLNTGTTGTGFIDAFALRGVLTGYGPTIVGNVRTGPAYNAISPRWAVGNLNQIGYGHGSNIYGFAAGNPAGAYVYTDDTNGLVMSGPLGARVTITPAGVATFVGDGGGVTNINGGNITTGSVTADKIAAGAITTEKLFVGTAIGAALNDDPSTSDASAWIFTGGASVVDVTTAGRVGRYALRAASGSATGKRRVPVDPAKAYRYRVWVHAAAGTNGALYSGVQLEDGNGAPILTSGGEWFWCASGITAVDWTEYACPFGAGTVMPLPANARAAAPTTYLNFGGTAGYWEIQDVRIEEMSPSTLIRDGAITTDKIVANAITAEKIAAGSITATKIASGSGTNLIRNSECRVGHEEWTFGNNTGLAGRLDSHLSPAWMLLGEPSVCYLTIDATPAAGTVTYTDTLRFPAAPGQVYEASTYLGTHGGTRSHIVILFFDQTANFTGVVYGNDCTAANFGGQFLADYCRSSAIGTAPAGTVWVQARIQHIHDGIRTTPYLMFVRVMLAEGKPNQTQPSEWTPAGLTEITGGIIKTDAIDARAIAAGAITASELAAGSVTAGSIAAGSITGDKIAARTIAAGNIAAGNITGTEIAAATISGGHIGANTITAANIAASTISADKLNVSTLSAISSNIGTITAGTITGVLIDGVTILAGSGDEVRLDNNGITVATSGGSGPGTIKIGGTSIFADASALSLNAAQTYARGYLEAQGNFHSTGAITSAGNITSGAHVYAAGAFSGGWLDINAAPGYLRKGLNLTDGFAWGNPPYINSLPVHWSTGCNCIGQIGSTITIKENIRPWAPADPLAILTVPLVRYDLKAQPLHKLPVQPDILGIIAEDLIKVAREAVVIDAQGDPLGINPDALTAYLLAAIRAVNDRIPRLEQKILDLELRLAAAEAARRGGNDR